jgi:hypothetical protein
MIPFPIVTHLDKLFPSFLQLSGVVELRGALVRHPGLLRKVSQYFHLNLRQSRPEVLLAGF